MRAAIVPAGQSAIVALFEAVEAFEAFEATISGAAQQPEPSTTRVDELSSATLIDRSSVSATRLQGMVFCGQSAPPHTTLTRTIPLLQASVEIATRCTVTSAPHRVEAVRNKEMTAKRAARIRPRGNACGRSSGGIHSPRRAYRSRSIRRRNQPNALGPGRRRCTPRSCGLRAAHTPDNAVSDECHRQTEADSCHRQREAQAQQQAAPRTGSVEVSCTTPSRGFSYIIRSAFLPSRSNKCNVP